MRTAHRRHVVLLALVFAFPELGALAAPESDVPSALVHIRTPARGSIADSIIAYGTAVPAANGGMTLSVQGEGRVLKLFVTAGEGVRAGQRLLEFELSAVARSTYEQAVAALKLAREDRIRTTRLLDQQLATRDQLARADKALADAQAALDALEHDYGNKPLQTLVAPFDGVVSALPVPQGARVSPGTALVGLTRTDGLVVRVGVEPAHRARLKLGQSAQVETLSGSSPALVGKLVRVDRVLNPTSRLVDADVAVAGALLQGEAFRVRVELGRLEGWLVPRDAVSSGADGMYVFQVADGKAVRVAVKVLGTDASTAIVDGPIDPRKPLVIQGNYQLSDGMAVRGSGG